MGSADDRTTDCLRTRKRERAKTRNSDGIEHVYAQRAPGRYEANSQEGASQYRCSRPLALSIPVKSAGTSCLRVFVFNVVSRFRSFAISRSQTVGCLFAGQSQRLCALTASGSPIRRRLEMEQLGVGAAAGEERFVGALLFDPAVFEDEDPVREAHGAEAMADEEGHLAFGQRLHLGE